MKNKLMAWLADKQGVTGIEYAFIIGAVGTVLVGGGCLFSGEFGAMQDVLSGYWSDSTTLG